MAVILVTGMSGTGKSTVLKLLEKRGHRVVDTDFGGWIDDEVVLFSAPLEVLLERIANRDTNPFGKAAEERDRIVADMTETEPKLRSSATVEIDTRKPLADVVGQLAALAGAPPRR